jgi:hypothetical protein
MRETHHENSTLLLEKWMLCMMAVVIQQVLARMKVRNRLEWILFLKHRISLKMLLVCTMMKIMEHDKLEVDEDGNGHEESHQAKGVPGEVDVWESIRVSYLGQRLFILGQSYVGHWIVFYWSLQQPLTVMACMQSSQTCCPILARACPPCPSWWSWRGKR